MLNLHVCLIKPRLTLIFMTSEQTIFFLIHKALQIGSDITYVSPVTQLLVSKRRRHFCVARSRNSIYLPPVYP